MRLFALAALLLGLCGSALPAQANVARIRRLVAQADTALSRKTEADARRALQLLREARGLAPAPPAPTVAAWLYAGLAQAFEYLSSPDSAMHYTRLAIPAMRDIRDYEYLTLLYFKLAFLHSRANQPDSAIAGFRAGIAAANLGSGKGAGAEAYLAIVQQFEKLNRVDSAYSYTQTALRIARRDTARTYEAIALYTSGRLWLAEGHYRADSAVFFLRQGLQAMGRAGIAVPAQTYLALATYFYSVFLPDSSVFYGRRALQAAAPGDTRTRLDIERSLSRAFEGARALDSSRAHGRAALALARQTGDPTLQAEVLAEWGANWGTENPDSGAAALREALTRLIPRGDPLTVARLRSEYGWTLLLGRKYDSALAEFRLAEQGTRQAGKNASWMTQQGIGRVFLERRQWDSAEAYLASAFALKAEYRRGSGSDLAQVSIAESGARSLDAMWTTAWFQRAPHLGVMEAMLGGLEATERTRGQVLADLRRVRNPDELDAALQQSLQQLGVAAPTTLKEGFPARARQLLFSTGRNTDLILYFHVGAEVLTVWSATRDGTPNFVQRRLPSDSLVRTIGAYLESLNVTQAGLGVTPRGQPLERGSIAAGAARPENAAKLGARLGEWLFPAELKGLIINAREIVIVPHGLLGQLPFGALPDPSGKGPVGSVRALRYAPSLRILEHVERGAASRKSKADLSTHAVVVGNPSMPAATIRGMPVRLSPLPGAEMEGREIAGLLGLTPLSGTAASETAIRSRLAQAPLVHLATHGFAFSRTSDAGRSFVALAPDTLNDGFLTVEEVISDPALRLDADLVVLSACQTGLGSLQEAEGTVGLQRAFLSRGARSVLVSLWNVSDEASRLLMTQFYRHWLDDGDHPGKAEALRRAQSDVRSTRGFEAPRFWAAFQLVGAN